MFTVVVTRSDSVETGQIEEMVSVAGYELLAFSFAGKIEDLPAPLQLVDPDEL